MKFRTCLFAEKLLSRIVSFMIFYQIDKNICISPSLIWTSRNDIIFIVKWKFYNLVVFMALKCTWYIRKNFHVCCIVLPFLSTLIL